jgi:hypothetical protein
MRTVLIADKNGQLGNQLFLFAHFISNSIENNYRIYFPAFNDLSIYFENASINNYGNYPIHNRFFKSKVLNNFCLRILKYTVAVLFRTVPVSKWYRLIRLYHLHDLNINHYSFYDIETEPDFSKNEKLLILQGWSFRSPKSVRKYRETVRQLFHLRKEWRERVNTFMEKSRNGCDIIIGVHVRRGDYKTFLNGIYFYDNAIYRKYMMQIKELFPGKKIRFIISSNENVKLEPIEGCLITNADGHFVVDMYTLAECDYIIGPPSTYSQWASYYGNKPLRILWEDQKEILTVDEFKISNL